MAGYEQQVIENSKAIAKILADAKDFNDFPTATSFLNTDFILMYSSERTQVEKIPISELVKIGGWYWIDGSFVQKGVGNTNTTTLETDDVVYFKEINNASDPVTLIGFTYNGGDSSLIGSYTQNQSIAT